VRGFLEPAPQEYRLVHHGDSDDERHGILHDPDDQVIADPGYTEEPCDLHHVQHHQSKDGRLAKEGGKGLGLPFPEGKRDHAECEKHEPARDKDEEPERNQIIIEENDRNRDDHEVVAGRIQVPANVSNFMPSAGHHSVQRVRGEYEDHKRKEDRHDGVGGRLYDQEQYGGDGAETAQSKGIREVYPHKRGRCSFEVKIRFSMEKQSSKARVIAC